MSCSVEYNGTICMVPQFDWTNYFGASEEGTITSIQLMRKSTIVALAEPPFERHTCNVNFDRPTTAPVVPDESTEVPAFSFSWMTDLIRVLCEYSRSV